MTYLFVPGMCAVVAVAQYQRHDYGFAAFYAFAFVFWIWRYPWFVRLVIRSLLGLEP